MIIDGRKIAAEIISKLKKELPPGKILAAILVGENMQSRSFLKQKENFAGALGINFQVFSFSDSVQEEELINEIEKIGRDKEIGGLIVQLPLPPHFNRDRILAAVNPNQDVDAISLKSRGRILPLSVMALNDILDSIEWKINDKRVAVIGRGFLTGRPVAEWLADKCRELVVLDVDDNLKKIKGADLVISGVGNAGIINPAMLRVGALVIDFGYDAVEMKTPAGIKIKKLKGDLDTDLPASKHHFLDDIFYTPTPGGTGPVLVAEIFRNFYKLNPLV